MISWIRGEIIDTWIHSKKFYVLLNCKGIGYEIQILDSLNNLLEKETITLWIEQIKREDSEILFGFKERIERDFFRDILSVKGIGPQIGMSLLNNYDLFQIINSINIQDKTLFNSVPGIGKKMTERILFEFKNKTLTSIEKNNNPKETNFSELNNEIKNVIEELDLALKSLSYLSRERKDTISFIVNKISEKNKSENITFENLLKVALDYLQEKQYK